MNIRTRFLVVFFFCAFGMKIIGELVHEVVGHGFFVLLFGGEIARVHISLLWPYELSSITPTQPPGGFEAWQLVWIDGGGILVSLIVSCVIQVLLLKIVKDWRLSTLLFWLSFWTFLNPAGYLVVGGIRPFGDVAALITRGVLSQETSLLAGTVIFVAAFFAMTRILMNLLFEVDLVRDVKVLRIYLGLFWLVIPIVTAIYCLGARQPLSSFQIFTTISLAPVLVAFIMPSILLHERNTSMQEKVENY